MSLSSTDDSAARHARRAAAVRTLDAREYVAPLSGTEALRRSDLIDRAQASMHRLEVGGQTGPGWAGAVERGIGIALVGAVVSRENPSWLSIGGLFVLAAAAVAGASWKDRRRAALTGLSSHERRMPRAGHVSSLGQVSGLILIVVVASAAARTGAWWIGVPFGVAAVPLSWLAARRWYRAFDAPPALRGASSKAVFSRIFAADAALRVAAALAIVDWARTAVVAEATDLHVAEVDRWADRLHEAGYLDHDGFDDDRGPALELTLAGRRAFARHVAWIESPGGAA